MLSTKFLDSPRIYSMLKLSCTISSNSRVHYFHHIKLLQMICLMNIELMYHTQTAGHFLFVTSLLRREFGSVYHMTVPNMVVT